jgi:spermidine synthase
VVVLCLWQARSVEAWDRAVISSGSFMPYRIQDLKEAEKGKNRVLFYDEGIHTTVTTELAVSGNIFLRVNGKTDASLALDMRTQLLSGYLPMFFHENPQKALVIGQGSGITLGAVEQFPVQSVDLVEISSAVIEGSRFFSPFNHNALDDPRLNQILEDGRNHIALSDTKYDVIISEPSNPWISGVGVLFTVDFFELVKKRLNPGGIVCIWVHTNMSPESFKSITRSFSEKLPYVTMWESIVGDDYLLIGSESPYRLPFERVERFINDPAKGKDLRGIGIYNIGDLISLMAMSRDGLLAFSGNAPIHTDDNSLLEFNAPKYIYRDDRDVLVRQLTPYIKIEPELIRFSETNEEERQQVLREIASVVRSESQIKEIKRKAKVDRLLDQAQRSFNDGKAARALDQYSQILRIDPENVMTYLNMGNVFNALGRYDRAETAYKMTLAINPYYIFGHVALANQYISQEQPEKAIEILEPLFDWYPGDTEVRFYLGLAYAFQKKPDRAIEELRKAVELNPRYFPAHYYLGLQYRTRNPKLSRKHLETFLDLAGSGKGSEKMIMRAEKLLKKL